MKGTRFTGINVVIMAFLAVCIAAPFARAEDKKNMMLNDGKSRTHLVDHTKAQGPTDVEKQKKTPPRTVKWGEFKVTFLKADGDELIKWAHDALGNPKEARNLQVEYLDDNGEVATVYKYTNVFPTDLHFDDDSKPARVTLSFKYEELTWEFRK